jgi:hypothetical protein
MAEHSAVNRRVVSSSLTCGAILIKENKRLGKKFTISYQAFLIRISSEFSSNTLYSCQKELIFA